MRKGLFIYLIFFMTASLVFSSEFIIYVDEEGKRKQVDDIQDIYDVNDKISEIELDLSKLEEEQNLNKLKQIYKSELKGEKLLNDINSIELKLESIRNFEQKADDMNIEKIKKEEREKIRKLEIAIETLESKNLVNKRELERLKKELEQRKKRLNNLDNTLEQVSLLKNKLENRLEKFKEESFIYYEVKKGDFLWKISNKPEFYGKGRLWPLIYRYNMDKIKDPDLIQIGWKLKIPIKKYEVKKSDRSIYEIAEKIYNDRSKWRWIYWANQNKIKNIDKIKDGWILKIPLE